jgi:hypothetical protein
MKDREREMNDFELDKDQWDFVLKKLNLWPEQWKKRKKEKESKSK